MKKLILALALIAFAAPALAQTAAQIKRPALTGNIGADIKNAVSGGTGSTNSDFKATRQKVLQALAKPFQDIAEIIGDGVSNAITLSTAIPDLKDGHGQQCWIALRNFSAITKAHPLPLTGQIATDLEALRLLNISANQLCSNVHCTQMFTDFTAMAQAVARNAVGALGGIGAKAMPSLQDACSMIPQIALVAPIDPVPAAPEIAPVGTGN